MNDILRCDPEKLVDHIVLSYLNTAFINLASFLSKIENPTSTYLHVIDCIKIKLN